MSVTANTRLAVSDEQAMLLEVAREFCRDKSPVSAVRELLDSPEGFDESIWQEMTGLGWPGVALPERVGGAGLGVSHLVGVFEAMGRSLLTTPLLASTVAGQLAARACSDGRADEVLTAIAAGAPATVAELEGPDWGGTHDSCHLDRNGVLQGRKHFVLDAMAASWFVVVARHDEEPVLVLVSAAQLADDAIRPHTLVDETRRAGTVDFSGVQVAPEAVIVGSRVTAALHDAHLLGALLVAAEAAGSAGACLDLTVDYLKTRKQFGKLIGSYQALKHPCVEILNAVDNAKSFIYHAASLLDDGELGPDAEIACRMAKAQAAEALEYAADRAVQFHGGMGFTYECDAQLYIRRAQWSRQQFGDPMFHRKRLAALLLDR